MQTLQLQRLINVVLQSSIKEDGIYGNVTKTHHSKLITLLSKYLLPNFEGFVCIRCSEVFDNRASDFALYIQNQEIKEVLPCTTRAGHYFVYNPISYGGITGTAVLAEGLYPKAWKGIVTSRFGFSSPELMQVRPVKIFRDRNKDLKIDREVTQEGLFGINMHTQGAIFSVDNWSAGCITVPSWAWAGWFNIHFQLGKLYDLYLINIQEVWQKR
jgi:hypothetical protein